MQTDQDTTIDDLHRTAGVNMTLFSNGMSPSEFEACRSFVDEIDDSADFHRKVAAAVAHVYEAAGKSDSVQRRIFTKLASSDRWSQAHTVIMDAAYSGLTKSAAEGIIDSLLKALTGSAKLTSQTISTGAGLSALLGAGIGTLNWTAGRYASEDDEKAEAAKARIAEFQRVSNEIDNELKIRKLDGRA